MEKFSILLCTLLFTLPFSAQKVFSVDYKSQTDVKVFVVKYENQAGWNKKEKKQLMY